jgi:hypothetical protein
VKMCSAVIVHVNVNVWVRVNLGLVGINRLNVINVINY